MEITDMSLRSDEFFKVGPLIDKIGLCEEESTTAAVGLASVALESITLDI